MTLNKKSILNIVTLCIIGAYIVVGFMLNIKFNFIIAFAVASVYQRAYKKVKDNEFDLYFKFMLVKYFGFIYFIIAEFISIYFFHISKNGVGILIIAFPTIVLMFVPIIYNTYKLYKWTYKLK